MIDSNRLLDMLDSNGLIKRGDSRLPSDLNSASRPDKILLENGLIDQEAMTQDNPVSHSLCSATENL